MLSSANVIRMLLMLFTGISLLSGSDHFFNNYNKILLLASIILSPEFQCLSGSSNGLHADAVWLSAADPGQPHGALKRKLESSVAFGS
jgi:hypothetical protein